MKTLRLGNSALVGSRLVYGCWRIAGTWNPEEVTTASEKAGRTVVRAAYEAGFTVFDLADIYCDGVAEQIFGEALREIAGMRANVLVATKCGIRKRDPAKPGTVGRYDFSAEHIVASCEASLRRLRIATIDLYQLHRPDYLMNPDEVAAAFTTLQQGGKVREFGVSNFRPSQVTLLQKSCPMKLLVNQVEISLAHLEPLDDGTLDQCLAEKMTPMAWSPLGGGHLADGARKVLASQEGYRSHRVLDVLDSMAKMLGTGRTELALAWLLKHPSGIMPIVGSTSPANIRQAARADDLKLSREDWYRLLVAARGEALP